MADDPPLEDSIAFIEDNCKGQCTKEDIIQILELYYGSDEPGDPSKHSKRIAEETNLSSEIIIHVITTSKVWYTLHSEGYWKEGYLKG